MDIGLTETGSIDQYYYFLNFIQRKRKTMMRPSGLESDKVVWDTDPLSGQVSTARASQLALLTLMCEAAGEADQPRDPGLAGPVHQVSAQRARAGRQQPRPDL